MNQFGRIIHKYSKILIYYVKILLILAFVQKVNINDNNLSLNLVFN